MDVYKDAYLFADFFPYGLTYRCKDNATDSIAGCAKLIYWQLEIWIIIHVISHPSAILPTLAVASKYIKYFTP